jgi:type II secretory pathway pseudopilin PulG
MKTRLSNIEVSTSAGRPARASRRSARQAFVEVEYLVVLACIGIVVAIAIYKFGPMIVRNYNNQETVILQQGP